MSLERINRHGAARTRQTVLQDLVQAIAADAEVSRAYHSLRAGDREAALTRALQRHFGGETLRVYVPARTACADEVARRVVALATAPSCMAPAQIAQQLGITARHVRRILARAQ